MFSTFISAILGLVIGTLFGGWLERVLYRPHVIIEIEKESFDVLKEQKYVSVVVSNRGWTAAVDCVGSISIDGLTTEVLLSSSDALKDLKLPFKPNAQLLITPEAFRELDRELLCWAHVGNPQTYTINPGVKTLLDVFMAIKRDSSGEWYLIIPSEGGWKKLRAGLKDGNYSGRLAVSPANAPPTIQEFKIKPSSEGPRLALKSSQCRLTSCLWFASLTQMPSVLRKHVKHYISPTKHPPADKSS